MVKREGRTGAMMPQDDTERKSDTRFQPGHLVNETHGGEGAIQAIRDGKPFSGMAALAEREVRNDLATQGRAAIVEELAVRLTTAARLFWGALCSAADAGDLGKMDSYVARFGWLAASASRAWRELRAELEAGPDAGAIDYEQVVKKAKEQAER